MTGPELGQRANYPQGDPYEELYLSKSPVVGAVNPSYLTGNPDATEGESQSAWRGYERKMRSARAVMEGVGDWQLPGKTYHVYGTNVPTLDRVDISLKIEKKGWARHVPIVGPMASDESESGNLVKFLPHSDSHELRMEMDKDSTSSGDGTVPESSGSFLGQQPASCQKWPVPNADHEKALGPAADKIVHSISDIVRKELARVRDGS